MVEATSKIVEHLARFSKQTFDWYSDLSHARITTLKVFGVNYQEYIIKQANADIRADIDGLNIV